MQQKDKSKALRTPWFPSSEVYLCIHLATGVVGDFRRLRFNSHSRSKCDSIREGKNKRLKDFDPNLVDIWGNSATNIIEQMKQEREKQEVIWPSPCHLS